MNKYYQKSGILILHKYTLTKMLKADEGLWSVTIILLLIILKLFELKVVFEFQAMLPKHLTTLPLSLRV